MMKSSEVRRQFWQVIRAGADVEQAATRVGASRGWGERVFNDSGGVNLVPVAEPVGRYLSHREREEIMCLDSSGHGVRAIARPLGRSPATISRKLRRGSLAKQRNRASFGQRLADRGRRAEHPGRRSWRPTYDCAAKSPTGCDVVTVRPRSLEDSESTTPITRRCACQSRRATSRCISSPAAGCAAS